MVSLSNHCTAHRDLDQCVACTADRFRKPAHLVAEHKQCRTPDPESPMLPCTFVLFDANDFPSFLLQRRNNVRRRNALPHDIHLRSQCRFFYLFLHAPEAVEVCRCKAIEVDLGDTRRVRRAEYRADVVCTSDVVEQYRYFHTLHSIRYTVLYANDLPRDPFSLATCAVPHSHRARGPFRQRLMEPCAETGCLGADTCRA